MGAGKRDLTVGDGLVRRWQRCVVMNPMAKARGLQLTRCRVSAYGCMTSARQDCSCREYNAEALTLDILPWRRFPPGTANVQLETCCLNRLLRRAGVPEHTTSIAQARESGAYPSPKGRGLRATKK